MADGLTITGVKGLDELLRRLDQMPLALSRTVARQALEEAGALMQSAAEASAPKRSGELADDIIVEVHVAGDLRSNRVLIGPGYDRGLVKPRKRGRYAGQQDTTTSPGVYGKFVESGHGMAGHSWKSRRSGKQIELGSHDVPPHPWLKPAFDATIDAAVQVLADRTKEALDRIDTLVR